MIDCCRWHKIRWTLPVNAASFFRSSRYWVPASYDVIMPILRACSCFLFLCHRYCPRKDASTETPSQLIFIMDIANQLFSLTLGVEPNKQTLQNLAGTLNSAGE